MKSDDTKLKPIDAEGILRTLSEIRRSIPFLNHDAPPPVENERTKGFLASAMDPEALTEFDYLTVADGVESLANELEAALNEKHEKALVQALEIFYAAEELARDPAHADLIPQVEAMREAYLQSYGKPIPPKKK